LLLLLQLQLLHLLLLLRVCPHAIDLALLICQLLQLLPLLRVLALNIDLLALHQRYLLRVCVVVLLQLRACGLVQLAVILLE